MQAYRIKKHQVNTTSSKENYKPLGPVPKETDIQELPDK